MQRDEPKEAEEVIRTGLMEEAQASRLDVSPDEDDDELDEGGEDPSSELRRRHNVDGE